MVLALGVVFWRWGWDDAGGGGGSQRELMSSPAQEPTVAAAEQLTEDAASADAPEGTSPAPTAADALRAARQNAGGAGMSLGDGRAEDSATLESLLSQADEAYDSGEFYQALPLYKEVAVRLQGRINQLPEGAERDAAAAQLENVKELVRDTEKALRELAGRKSPGLAERTPHEPPNPGEIRELGIAELGNFPYDDAVGGVPPDVAALDGSQVRMTGYMLPGFQTDQIEQFTLVIDVYECCFGEPPGVEHTINVIVPEGRTVTFTYGEVQVTGTLRVEEQRRDGFVVNLFTIEDVTSIRETGRQ